MKKLLVGFGILALFVIAGLSIALGVVTAKSYAKDVVLAQYEMRVTNLEANLVAANKKNAELDAAYWYERLTAEALVAAYARFAPDYITTVEDTYCGPIKIWLREDGSLVTEMFRPFGHDFSAYGPGLHDESGRNISETLSTGWYTLNIGRVSTVSPQQKLSCAKIE